MENRHAHHQAAKVTAFEIGIATVLSVVIQDASVEPLSYIHYLTFFGANCQAKCNTFEK